MKKNLLSLLMLLLAGIMTAQADEQQLAFPGADGYGKYVTGGRGGEVCYVTRLDDCTDNQLVEGTLRWAIRHDNGGKPRTILFKVGGTIVLTNKLTFNYGDVSILGQTAPGGGICIAGYTFYINKNNIIVRYVRFRAGDLAGYKAGKSMASLDMENCKNVILDHCSMTWSMEECITAYDSDYTTVQWCIIGEGLYNSMNAKGARSYATQWGGEHSTMHHCLITNCNSRTPRFNGVRNESNIGQGKHEHDAQVESEFANNVIFNWGKKNSLYGGENDKTVNNSADGTEHLGYNRVYMINNYFRPGPNTSRNVTSERYFVQGSSDNGYGQWYLNGNKFEENSEYAGTSSQWSATNIANVNANNFYGYTSSTTERAFNLDGLGANQTNFDLYALTSLPEAGLSGLEYETADDAFKSVFKGAGARLPKLDAVDNRLLNEAHGDIAPKYFGPLRSDYPHIPACGKGIIDTPNNIDVAEYEADGYVTLTMDGITATNIYPKLDGTSTVADADGDGMPDAYEEANLFNKDDASDGAAIAANGYSNLENFLNAVVDGTVNPDGTTGINSVNANENANGNSQISKVIEGNRIIIKKGNKVYNITGQRAE
ncbi:MAG: Por secretion system protein [Prevotella sp.]|nr:Por secretion system protein [Prevotella sp.]